GVRILGRIRCWLSLSTSFHFPRRPTVELFSSQPKLNLTIPSSEGGSYRGALQSGAPYGYRYVKKSDHAEAYYEVIEAEAEIVRMIFENYTSQGQSINAIARLLNERQIPTRSAKTRWERSTVWGILRNPAYQGKACFGKTELRPRQRITRPLRQRNRMSSRNSANHERPRQDWIEIPVPALVNETIFALAQE